MLVKVCFRGAACQVVQRPDGCEGPVDTNAVYVSMYVSVENQSKVQCVPLDALQRVENGKGICVRLIPEIVELFDSEGILRGRYNLPCAFTVALDNRPEVDRINFPIEMLNYFSR